MPAWSRPTLFIASAILFNLLFSLPLPPFGTVAAESLSVVINEVAWMGTKASSNDEWLELFNNTDSEIDLDGWGLYESGGETLIEPLTGKVAPHAYYLVERSDDSTIADIPSDQEPGSWGGYGLNDERGEYLMLKDSGGGIVDEIDCREGWFAGGSEPKASMERIDSLSAGNEAANWGTNDGVVKNGKDAGGNDILGTPGKINSVFATTEGGVKEDGDENEDEVGGEGDEEEDGAEGGGEEVSLVVSGSSAASITAEEEFVVTVSLRGGVGGADYYLKFMADDGGGNFSRGRTLAADGESWLWSTAAWSQHPTLETDGNGSAAVTIKAKIVEAVGELVAKVRVRLVEAGENFDSGSWPLRVGGDLTEDEDGGDEDEDDEEDSDEESENGNGSGDGGGDNDDGGDSGDGEGPLVAGEVLGASIGAGRSSNQLGGNLAARIRLPKVFSPQVATPAMALVKMDFGLFDGVLGGSDWGGVVSAWRGWFYGWLRSAWETLSVFLVGGAES